MSAANRTAAPVAPVPSRKPRLGLTRARHFPGRRSTSLRTRIAWWTILLLTGVTVTTVVAAHVLLMERTSTEITAELRHEVDEFNSISPPPSARSPVIRHMRMATARVVPSSDVVKFGLVDGRLVAVSRNVPPIERRADLPVLQSLVHLPLPAGGNTTLDQGSARFVVVPVHVAGDPVRGAFVIATLTEPAYAQVWSDTRLQIEVGLVCLLVAYGLAWAAAGRTLRPVRETTELARRISATALGGRLPVRGHDEFDHMADSFNDMLDRLEDTLETQRRFLADAGHELRTPITIVQGNLDTLSVSDPEDAETLALVSTELDRMTRMVNDLLVLASSHLTDFVRLRTADLGALGVSLAAKVDALGDRSWSHRSTWSGMGLLDVDRVTQAVVELCSNALTYTRPGTDLSLRLSEEGSMLVVCVVDHGPGVPVEFAERVFGRFVRADGASRMSAGSGLGLSIVTAIASGHGGDVAVSQTPGGGATFILRLPREPAPGAGATDRTA
ncbi:MAG: ATP-binding protein [Pedococcus sp.]